jgi:hypothetical protein
MSLSANVTDPDSGQTLTLTLKQDTLLLDKQTVASPATNLPVSFATLTFAPGPHALTIEVSDGTATASCQTLVTVNADTVAPVITCPPDQTVPASSPTGAIVNYASAGASDTCSIPVISYSQNSGTLFGIGDTLVTVTAMDAANNQATCSFTVHVSGANEQVGGLIAYVARLPIHAGFKFSLLAKLSEARIALELRNPRLPAACEALQALINETRAQRGRKLTVPVADELISAASRIRAVIGCN